MGALTKDRLIFDPADAAASDNIGAFVRAGSDGDLVSSTNIGGKEALDVNIVGGADSGIFAEDSAHVSGDKGQFILAVRQDADTAMAADGDYTPLQTDENGRLKVVADIEVANGFEKLEDSAHASGDVGAYMLSVRADSRPSNANVSADGDYASLFVDNKGALWVDAVGNVADDAVDSENPVKVGSKALSGALAAVSTSGDRADLISDMYRRVWINDSPNIASAAGAVAVDNVAEVALPASALAGRRRMFIQNLGDKDIYVGPTGVAVGSGMRIAKGATLSLEIGPNVILYAISGSATPTDVRVLQLA